MGSAAYKQVIVVRTDLKMGKGKLAVQAAHAAVAGAEKVRRTRLTWFEAWWSDGQGKIAVKVRALSELLALKERAERLNLPTVLVEDRGLTQLEPGTVTCLGIGPAPASRVDPLTRDLRLL